MTIIKRFFGAFLKEETPAVTGPPLDEQPVQPSPLPEPLDHQKMHKQQRANERFMREISTHLWRLNRRLGDPEDEEDSRVRRIHRDIEALKNCIQDAGITIQDPVGQRYDSGLQLKVLAFEPRTGITSERVEETVRPAVYVNNQLIQLAEVIVATPEKTIPYEEPPSSQPDQSEPALEGKASEPASKPELNSDSTPELNSKPKAKSQQEDSKPEEATEPEKPEGEEKDLSEAQKA